MDTKTKQNLLQEAQAYLKACKDAAEPFTREGHCADVRAQLNGEWDGVIAARRRNFTTKLKSNLKNIIK